MTSQQQQRQQHQQQQQQQQHRRPRGVSFDQVDGSEASGVLADVLDRANAYVGGCSIGPGLKKAARHYLEQRKENFGTEHLRQFPGASDLKDRNGMMKVLEDPFYVLDIGVVVSQVYQWRRFFPRVEPFYAIKCNPDPVIVQTLAVLGCNFDCASRNEIRLVQDTCSQLSRQPDIIFANPCKPVSHLIESVARGVRLVTFDNAAEVAKCASVSGKIELVLRIITDDRGSQCRLSSKYGAPRGKWRPLLAAAKQHGLTVVGVSFHVGSGCRDATKYLKPLQDAREIFDMAETEFGMKLQLVDIGGGFPGETHSIWNPVVAIDEVDDDGGDTLEGKPSNDNGEADKNRFMFFQEIAQQVAPMIDELFPPESGIRIISEPGRYFTAAAATLCCSVISCRSNETDESYVPEPVNDKQAAKQVDAMTRQDERELVVRTCSGQLDSQKDEDEVMATIQEELKGFSKFFAAQQLTQQEVDVYNDSLDWFKEGFDTAIDMLGPPDKLQKHHRTHTVEGITYPLVAATGGGDDQDKAGGGLLPVTLSAAGEAAVKGLVLQAVADSAPLQDDFAYYINEGIYGAFNNLMYDHASVRPRVLRASGEVLTTAENGFGKVESDGEGTSNEKNGNLYASTVFGPTCDGIDIVARSVLLPKLSVGDWMYFENMGAYTMAAASSFNGFAPSEKLYCCSVMPEYFEEIIAGPEARKSGKKKERESDKQQNGS